MLVVLGEILVGVTLLVGLGVRISACVGVFMCANYFFATMHTGPSSIGVNLAFIFSCLTMVLAGPGKALGLDALLSTKKRLGWL